MDIIEMRDTMKEIVIKCLNRHKGGESYFNELDDMVKNNVELICSYINHIVINEKVNNIIVSGEIGRKILLYNAMGFLLPYIKIIAVNGGLRKGGEIDEINLGFTDFLGEEFIFIDDSFYSGKTANKVNEIINKYGGTLLKVYVFYDGSKEKCDNVKSLFRYYDDVEEATIPCKTCRGAEWYALYNKLVYGCDMMHCMKADEY